MEFKVKCKEESLVCIIDKEDWERVSKYKWYGCKHGYTYYIFKTEKGMSTFLHRFILGIWQSENKIKVDHINRNGLDNRKENLRIVNISYNLQNRVSWGALETMGVSYHKESNKYSANIFKDKKKYFLGYFDTERLAGIAYDLKAKELYGELALVNKIDAGKKEIEFVKSYVFRKDNKQSKYKGVTKVKNKFRACCYNQRQITIGLFDSEIEAALAYNKFVIDNKLKRKLNEMKEM